MWGFVSCILEFVVRLHVVSLLHKVMFPTEAQLGCFSRFPSLKKFKSKFGADERY